jgi:hypothetical protein
MILTEQLRGRPANSAATACASQASNSLLNETTVPYRGSRCEQGKGTYRRLPVRHRGDLHSVLLLPLRRDLACVKDGGGKCRLDTFTGGCVVGQGAPKGGAKGRLPVVKPSYCTNIVWCFSTSACGTPMSSSMNTCRGYSWREYY